MLNVTIPKFIPGIRRIKEAFAHTDVVGGVSGHYKFERVKAGSGIIVESTPWMTNLITDAGLERLGTLGAVDYCHVGTGSTAPANTDTNLTTKIATTTNVTAETFGNAAASPYYAWYRRTYRFGAGAAAGNLTEVGVGWATTGGLFSHSLIKDGSGNPITVTVLSDEYLDVTFEFRLYAPTTDVTSSVTMNSVAYTVVSRACNVLDTTAWSAKNFATMGATVLSVPFVLGTAYNGTLGAVTAASPSGTSSDNLSYTVESYVANSKARNFTAYWGLNEGNLSGITAVTFTTSVGTYQLSYTKTSGGGGIPKDETYVLTLTNTVSWARRAS